MYDHTLLFYWCLQEVVFILQELGVNCIELMPCHEFNELEYFSYNSVLGDHKYNVSTFLIYNNDVFKL
jgi:hypothetical protein